jgi:hypothetical protein
MTPTSDNSGPTTDPLLKLGIYDITQLRDYCEKAAKQDYLVSGLIGQQSLSLAVGDSNCGKSPFFYQLAVCVAGGVPFLGMSVKQGRVLYLDAENSAEQVADLTTTLAEYVGLHDVPSELLLFNRNNSPEGHSLKELVKTARPALIILDPIYAWFLDIEENSKAVTEAYSELRKLMKETGCAVIGITHVTKDSPAPQTPKREHLDKFGDVHKWFTRARGSGALINGCDNRIAFDLPSQAGNCKLVVGGYARVRGSFPLLRLTRDLDAEGDPRGYRRLSGINLLKPEWQAIYPQLPDVDFRFKEVKPHFHDSADATTNFLKACIAADLLEHDTTVKPKGAYRKKQPVIWDQDLAA